MTYEECIRAIKFKIIEANGWLLSSIRLSVLCSGTPAMSKKSSSRALQADFSIKPNELAFLVKEYLKSIDCNNALAAFIAEHPEASKVQAPVRNINPFLSPILLIRSIEDAVSAFF